MSIKSLSHIFVDFDETLFDHMSYLAWLELELHQMGKLPKGFGSFSRSVDNYHDVKSKVPLLRLYRHADHIAEVTDESWDLVSGEVEKLIKQQNRDFCYSDAHELLAWLERQNYDVRILTYGDGEYQRFKITTCAYLRQHHLPVHIIQRPKTEFLAEHFKHDKGILIDDKYPQNLASGWHHVWLDRQAKLTKPHKLNAGETKISRLYQVQELI